MGIDPDSFWNNTWVNNHRLGESHNLSQLDDWQRSRYVAFAEYTTTIGPSGKAVFKKINKPTDLFSLANDPKPKMVEGADAIKAIDGLIK